MKGEISLNEISIKIYQIHNVLREYDVKLAARGLKLLLGLYFGDTPSFDTPLLLPYFDPILPTKFAISLDFLNGGSKEGVSPKHRPNIIIGFLAYKVVY